MLKVGRLTNKFLQLIQVIDDESLASMVALIVVKAEEENTA